MNANALFHLFFDLPSLFLTLVLFLTDLPGSFKSFWDFFSVVSVDISVLPLNCVFDSNFHSRLVATTVFPILFVCGVAIVWLILRQRVLSKGGDDLQASLSMLTSQAIRFCVMFLFTVFPMVLPPSSTTYHILFLCFNEVHVCCSVSCTFVSPLSTAMSPPQLRSTRTTII